jgi:hypothetical protein
MNKRFLSSDKYSLNSLNIFIIFTIFTFIAIGCKEQDGGNNANTIPKSDINAIVGNVFSSNEVCSYPNGILSEKYGRFNQSWLKSKNDPNPNTQYYCSPSEKSVKIYDTMNDVEVSISYSALGSNQKGAYRISIEYWITSNSNIPLNVDQEYRRKNLIQFCSEITKKSLKSNLSKTMVERLQNQKRIGSPAGVEIAKPFCEKLAQGFVCVAENISQKDNLLGFKIFASEEAYQNYIDGKG